MTRVLWARHGHNEANVAKTFSFRRNDPALTERGRAQAERLAGEIERSDETVTNIYCSPLLRARQTAEVVADRLGLPITAELDELRQLNVGSLDGRSDPEAWDTMRDVLAQWSAGNSLAHFPGGENLSQLVSRLKQAFAEVDRTATGTALVVGHGAMLRAALPTLAGISDPGYDLQTGSCAILDTTPHTFGALSLVAWPTPVPN